MLTIDEISNAPAGPELDAICARFMGWHLVEDGAHSICNFWSDDKGHNMGWVNTWHPSVNDGQAMQLVHKFNSAKVAIVLIADDRGAKIARHTNATSGGRVLSEVEADTIALAVCRSAAMFQLAKEGAQ